jgi:hypothetical protein
MNFSQITKLAEETRDETYGILCGHDRWGYEVVGFYSDIVSTAKEEVESPYRKGKREKAENIARYRVQMMAHGEIDYANAAHRDEVALHRNELNFVAAGIKSGMIEEITEDDLLDD